jgi:hypothetical protein
MISLSQGEKIATIANKKSVYLFGKDNFDTKTNPHLKADKPIELLDTEFYKENDIKNKRKFKSLYKDDLLDEDLKEETDKYIDKMLKTSFMIDEGSVFPYPRKKSERVYISAPSGSGKSTFIGQYLEEIRKINKKRDIFIFSKTYRIPIEEKFWNSNEIKCEDFKNSVCIFDDIDTILDKNLLKQIRNFRDDMLECGRHYNITTICTSHLIQNYNKTRTLINEANAVVLFPKGAGAYSVKQFLEKNIGLNKYQIKKIEDLPTRWIYIWKEYPRYIVYQKGVMII